MGGGGLAFTVGPLMRPHTTTPTDCWAGGSLDTQRLAEGLGHRVLGGLETLGWEEGGAT